MRYAVYILYSSSGNRYYIGRTNDLERRLSQHNASSATGWTKRYQPWEVIYNETFPVRAEALRRERYLKVLKKPQAIAAIHCRVEK